MTQPFMTGPEPKTVYLKDGDAQRVKLSKKAGDTALWRSHDFEYTVSFGDDNNNPFNEDTVFTVTRDNPVETTIHADTDADHKVYKYSLEWEDPPGTKKTKDPDVEIVP